MIEIDIIPFIFLLVACFRDIKTKRIPNEVTYGMFLAGTLKNAAGGGVKEVVTGLQWVFFSLVMLTVFSKGFRMGGGDIKLALASAVWLKDEIILALFVAFLMLLTVILALELRRNGIKALAGRVILEALYGSNTGSSGERLPGALFISAGYIFATFKAI